MAAKNGKPTAAERMAIIETNFENMAKDMSEIKTDIKHIYDKIEIKNKVDDMHGILIAGNAPKTQFQKFAETAKNIKEVILFGLTILVLLGILLKVDFSQLLK